MEQTAPQKEMQKTLKISAKQANEIKVSKQIAETLKRQWEDLAKRQQNSGIKMRADRRITSVTFKKDENGKIAVQVNMYGGQTIKDNGQEKALDRFKEQTRLSYVHARVAEFLRKIREYGYAAVEGEIPPELKEAVLKGMEKANISTSYKGRAAEAAEARQTLQNAAKAADNAAKAADNAAKAAKDASDMAKGFGAAETAKALAAAALLRSAQESRNDPSLTKKGINVGEINQTRPGSCSLTQTITIKLPDGTEFTVTVKGQDVHQNRLKVHDIAYALWRQKNNALQQGDEELLQEAAKRGVRSLEDFKNTPNIVNNISHTYFPDLQKEHKMDVENQKRFNDPENRGNQKEAPKTLDIKPGKNIADLIDQSRDNRKKREESPDDKGLLEYLNAVKLIYGTDQITPEMLETAERLKQNNVDRQQLYNTADDKTLTSEQKREKMDALEKQAKENPKQPHKTKADQKRSNEQSERNKKEKKIRLNPENKDSQKKVSFVKELLEKEERQEKGEKIEITPAEKKLLDLVHLQYKAVEPLTADAIDFTKNQKALNEVLKSESLFKNIENEKKKKNNNTNLGNTRPNYKSPSHGTSQSVHTEKQSGNSSKPKLSLTNDQKLEIIASVLVKKEQDMSDAEKKLLKLIHHTTHNAPDLKIEALKNDTTALNKILQSEKHFNAIYKEEHPNDGKEITKPIAEKTQNKQPAEVEAGRVSEKLQENMKETPEQEKEKQAKQKEEKSAKGKEAKPKKSLQAQIKNAEAKQQTDSKDKSAALSDREKAAQAKIIAMKRKQDLAR